MKQIILTALMASSLVAGSFTLQSDDLEGQLSKKQEFNGFGCSGKNMSPELHGQMLQKVQNLLPLRCMTPMLLLVLVGGIGWL